MLTVAPDDGFDSLASLSEAEDYCASMGLAWTGTEPEKEAALRRGTQYLLGRYAIKAEHLDPVHSRVVAACCEAAVRARAGTLYVDVKPGIVTEKRVGPITEKYAETQRNGGEVKFTVIDDLLRGLTDGGMGQIKLVRA